MRGAPFRRGTFHQEIDLLAGGGQCPGGAAAVLQGEADEAVRAGAARSQIVFDLVYLAPETENNGGRHIGVIQDTGKSPAQLLRVGPYGVAAAFPVRESGHPVDVFGQGLIGVAAGNQFGSVSGAVGSSHNGDVVPRAHTPVGAFVAEKCWPALRSGDRLLPRGEMVLAGKFVEGQIVGMDMGAWSNGAAGASDRLAVTQHNFSGSDGPPRQLVPRGHRARQRDGALRQVHLLARR